MPEPERVPRPAVPPQTRGLRRRRRILVGAALLVAAIGVAVGLQTVTSTPQVSQAPSPGARFVRAERIDGLWQVTRSDGTRLTLDPKLGYDAVTLGLSPDGRWISYALGPESGSLLDLSLLRSDQTRPVRASQVAVIAWWDHVWSPDSSLVVVPVADADFNVVNTSGRILEHRGMPGALAGFTDDDSLGWVAEYGSADGETMAWQVTTLDLTNERSIELQTDPVRVPRGWAQLMLRQASLSPDHTRVAALLSDQRDHGRILVYNVADGTLIDHHDYANVDSDCPLRWEADEAVATRLGETCVLLPPP